MYCDYWNLTKPPFDNVPDASMYVDCHESMENVISETIFAIKEGNECLTVIVGEVGLGKTLSLRVIIDSLEPDKYKVALITNPALSFIQLLREIIGQITGKQCLEKKKVDLLEIFNNLLFETADQGKKIVIVIDEANVLSPSNLDDLRLLTNMQDDERNLFTLLLVGQMEFAKTLEHPKRANLFQRIGTYGHLEKLPSQDAVKDYIESRLKIAGADRQIFENEAIPIIWEFSEHGIPRLINKICKLCMKAGETNEFRTISAEVASAIADRFQKLGKTSKPQKRVEEEPSEKKERAPRAPRAPKAEIPKAAPIPQMEAQRPLPRPAAPQPPAGLRPPAPPVMEAPKPVEPVAPAPKPEPVVPPPPPVVEASKPVEPVVAAPEPEPVAPPAPEPVAPASLVMEEPKPVEPIVAAPEPIELKEVVPEPEPEAPAPLVMEEPKPVEPVVTAPEPIELKEVLPEPEPEAPAPIAAPAPPPPPVMEEPKPVEPPVAPRPFVRRPLHPQMTEGAAPVQPRVMQPPPVRKPIHPQMMEEAAPVQPPPAAPAQPPVEEPRRAEPKVMTPQPAPVRPVPPPIQPKSVPLGRPSIVPSGVGLEPARPVAPPPPPPPQAQAAPDEVVEPVIEAKPVEEEYEDVMIGQQKIKLAIPAHVIKQAQSANNENKNKLAGYWSAQILKGNPALTHSSMADPVSMWFDVKNVILKRFNSPG